MRGDSDSLPSIINRVNCFRLGKYFGCSPIEFESLPERKIKEYVAMLNIEGDISEERSQEIKAKSNIRGTAKRW